MLLIAHRGNTQGKNPRWENNPCYVIDALKKGYDVEIDVWYINGMDLFLGHDSPEYKVGVDFLNTYANKLWIHCKHIDALSVLSQDERLNVFFHKDNIVVTTKGYLWTAPGYPLTCRSIAVMPELSEGWDISKSWGVCSDNLYTYGRSVLDNDTR